MAAIDRLYLKDYYTFDDFRLWCLINKPELLTHFYHWNITWKEWQDNKANMYEESKSILEKIHPRYESVETLAKYLEQHYEIIAAGEKYLEGEIKYHQEMWEEIQDKDKWIDERQVPIANFSCDEDRWLLWHCPLIDIREEYLFKQCGYKEKWYYKAYMKFLKFFNLIKW